MRVLLLIDHLGLGGAQRQIVSLANELADHPNFCVHLFFYHRNFTHFLGFLDNRVKTHIYQKQSKLDLFLIFKLLRILKKENIDVVISYLKTPSIYNELAGLFHSGKVIVSERSAYKNPQIIGLPAKLRNQFHRLSDLVICNSQYHANLIKSHSPHLKEKVTVIYNYVQKEFFEVFSNRKYLNKKSFLCVGAINHNKNPILVIKAMGILKSKYHLEVSVSWAGEIRDLESDINYKKGCDKLIKKLGLRKDWIWLGKVANMPNLHLDYSHLILPSFYEGLPNAVIEGMASGLICLVSNVCENPSLIMPIYPQLLFSPDQPEALADLMFKMVEMDAKEINELSQKSHQRAKMLFESEKITAAYLQLIQ